MEYDQPKRQFEPERYSWLAWYVDNLPWPGLVQWGIPAVVPVAGCSL